MLCKIVLPSNEIFKLPSLPGTYEELFTAVRTRLQEDSMKIFILKYLDSDKELVSLTNQEDLQTAILTSQIDRMTTLRIFVSFRENSESIPMTVGPQTEESSVSSKLIKVLEKVGSHDQVRSGQSQAFEKLKNHPGSTLKTITENQVEAISSFIGARVEQAMEKNIKGLIPGLIAQFHEQRKTLINSHVSENQPESSLGSPELAYLTPTTRKADWFGSSCTECMCSECKNQIKGVKYVCLECSNYKCCEECENKESHNHPLLKLRVSQVVQTRRSLRINTNPRSNLLISPEAAKTCGKIPMSRQLLLKSVGEKKVPYSGKIFFENEEDCLIKIQPSQEYQVAVIVENTGKESWPVNARLRCVNGNFRNRQEELVPLDAGTRQVLHLDVQAPAQSGRYLSQWKLYYNDEEKVRPFGESLFIEMHVEDKSLRYSKSNKEEAFEKQSSSKRSTLTIRRGNTFSDTYSNIKEERRKLEQTESLNRKEVMAAYLNELFPGSIEEKLEFLNKEVCNIENEDMSKIIELYLQSLGKKRNGRSSQGNQRQDNQELMYTIS